MTAKPCVLILLGAYWPGHESTGPNISIKAMCVALADDFSFLIMARDRPFGETKPMVDNMEWHDAGHARIRYLEVGRMGARGLNKVIGETPHDVLMLNGFFDREFTHPALFARWLGLRSNPPVILSPRGEFSAGARSLKRRRKSIFVAFSKRARLLKNVTLHATSDTELNDVTSAFPDISTVLIENFRPLFALPTHIPRKKGQALRMMFLGRITPVKGLECALKALAAAARLVQFDIYGPISDPHYWAHCQSLISEMPPGVVVSYHGEIRNVDTPTTLAAHDVMLMPSFSENFGHAIFESLGAGTPVIIGDQTPWRALAKHKAGWDVPVEDVAAFAEAIRFHADSDIALQRDWRNGARSFAENAASHNSAPEKMRKLIHGLAKPCQRMV